MKRRLLLVIVVVTLFALPASAQASFFVAGNGEPAYTNTTTNTQFFSYSRPSGYYYFTAALTYGLDSIGSYATATSGLIGSPYVGSSGTLFANWVGIPGVSSLQSGHYYAICANDRYTLDNSSLWFPGANSSCALAPQVSGTTIDRSKPTVSNVSVEGSATYSNKVAGQTLELGGVYNDSISPPFPATYTCVQVNADPATACSGVTYQYAPACSNRLAGTSIANNPFDCAYPIQASDPDGPVVFCAMVADSSLPDNPSGVDQFGPFTSSNANLSTSSCGYVILDRAAPAVSIGGGAASASTGDLLSFSAGATDPAAGRVAGSGPTGTYTWSWGDNTANGSGVNASHTYTQAGTFVVTLSTADKAGNAASATKTITVSVPSGSGAIKTAPGGATGGGAAGGTVISTPTTADIAAATGTRATQLQSAGGLDVLTAKTVKITRKLKSLPLALTASGTGSATFALVLGGHIISQTGLQLTKAGSLGLSLKLPKHLKTGAYHLKVTFTPTGLKTAASKTLTIRFTGTARSGVARSTRSAVNQIAGGAPAEPGLGTAAAPAPPEGLIARP